MSVDIGRTLNTHFRNVTWSYFRTNISIILKNSKLSEIILPFLRVSSSSYNGWIWTLFCLFHFNKTKKLILHIISYRFKVFEPKIFTLAKNYQLHHPTDNVNQFLKSKKIKVSLQFIWSQINTLTIYIINNKQTKNCISDFFHYFIIIRK